MSNLVVARIGRDRQRYEDNFRLVSGCIPYKRTAGDDDVENQSPSGKKNMLRVLMLSSPKRDDLVFPKGGWEDDETVEEAAVREAMEEAGVKGILKETPLGTWEFRSKSSQEMLCSLEGCCRGYMFAMEVTEELDVWPEKENRSRIWLSIREATELCRYDWMRKALESFSEVMGDEETTGEEEEAESTVEQMKSGEAVSEVVVVCVSDCQIMSGNCSIKTLESADQHYNTIITPPPPPSHHHHHHHPNTDVDLMCMCS